MSGCSLERKLDCIRTMTLYDGDDDDADECLTRDQRQPLRWLRTMVWDFSEDGRNRVLLRSVVRCPTIERLQCRGLETEQVPFFLRFMTKSLTLLTSLDLRRISLDFLMHDSFLLSVANALGRSLRRLYLPFMFYVDQTTLDHFTQLEELDASWCGRLHSVDFCSATLRVLYANSCMVLTDDGLRNATRLEVLHVSGCANVTDVTPFAHCLLELNASCSCGIDSAALSNCRRLQVLSAYNNHTITTLQPFAARLRELDAGGCSAALNDLALVDVSHLVRLTITQNAAITTVAPFGAALRKLDATDACIGDAGLVTATKLMWLDAKGNRCIRSLAPFASTLRELSLGCGSAVNNAALSAATNLIRLVLTDDTVLSSIGDSCGRSLRHLTVKGKSSLTREGLSSVTQLVTWDLSDSIAAFGVGQ